MPENTKNNLTIVQMKLQDLKPNPNNSRTHNEKQIQKVANSIKEFGFVNPILIDENNMIIAGHGRVEGAKLLGLELVPTICLEHLTKDQIRAYIIADNRLAEEAGWDKGILKIELEYLMSLDLDFDATITGFEIPEIDLIINAETIEDAKNEKGDPADEIPEESEVVQRVSCGDIWQLGNHKLICGNALQEECYIHLLEDEIAEVIFTDAPYNVKIQGNVTTQNCHEEFAQASGEMSKLEFTDFLKSAMALQAKYSSDGSIHFQCMDWRHVEEMMNAGNQAYSELKNICVWDKGTGGLGSLFRSQHEFIFVFKNGTAPHINNVELGKHGRYRTNVWSYKGMHASNPEASKLCKLHPTVKPVTMIMDALLDCSKPGGIVLDTFGGSGSTLLAAERTKRKARLIELEPKYCSVIIYRWENLTGKKATLISNYEEMNHA